MPPCYLILFDDSPEEIDLSGGTMMVLNSAENLAVLTATLDTGVIKAYGGVGEVLSDPNTVPLMTVLKGLHPLKPAPEDGDIIAPGAVELN